MAQRSRDASLAVWLGVMATLMLACLFSIAGDYKRRDETYPFSQYQDLSSMRRDYAACKENAPVGFDCIMQPVLVSEGFIKQETKQ